jgi:hypothetical protein
VIDEDTLRIQATVNARLNEYPVNFSLLLPLKYEDTFEDGNGKTYEASDKDILLKGSEIGNKLIFNPEKRPNKFKQVASGRLTIEIPDEAEFTWPFKSYNPYFPDDRECTEYWTSVLRIPVQVEGTEVIMRIGT